MEAHSHYHKVAACQVLVSWASEELNERRNKDNSRFWKRKNLFKIEWTKKPDASRNSRIGIVNANCQIAANEKSASHLACVCEWKASEIAWKKGQSRVKISHILFSYCAKRKTKTSFTCYFGDKRQWANHFTTFCTNSQNNDAFGGPIHFIDLHVGIHS